MYTIEGVKKSGYIFYIFWSGKKHNQNQKGYGSKKS